MSETNFNKLKLLDHEEYQHFRKFSYVDNNIKSFFYMCEINTYDTYDKYLWILIKGYRFATLSYLIEESMDYSYTFIDIKKRLIYFRSLAELFTSLIKKEYKDNDRFFIYMDKAINKEFIDNQEYIYDIETIDNYCNMLKDLKKI